MRRLLPFLLLLAAVAARAAGAPDPSEEAVAREIDRMGHSLFKVREEAFAVLSDWARRDARTREALRGSASTHADLEVRERARMVLEETELDFAERSVGIPGLAARLKSEDLQERLEALLSLPRAREAFPILRRFVRDAQADPRLRAVALDLLARTAAPEAAQVLLAAAREADHPARTRAIFWLGKLRVEQAVPLLLAAARDSRDGARLAACHALAILADASAAPVFREIVQDLDAPEPLKVMALVGTGKLADAQAVPLLAAIVRRDPERPVSQTVRVFAARAMGRIHDRRSTDALVAVVTDVSEDPVVHREACLALAEGRAAEALRPLAAAVAEPRLPLHARKAAVAALRRLTGWSVEGTVDDQAVFYQSRISR